MQWRNFFTNKNLQNLIDTALQNNQELQITFKIEIAKNEARIRKGFYYQR
jgi:outer membrane protein TolC